MIEIRVEMPNLTELIEKQGADLIREVTLGIRDTMTVKHADAPRGGNLYRRGTRRHKASAPGEPPAVDSGNLLTSLQAEPMIDLKNLHGEIYLNDYGFMLEDGTKHIAARPWIVPSVEEFLANYQ
jgi:hypothetical protein